MGTPLSWGGRAGALECWMQAPPKPFKLYRTPVCLLHTRFFPLFIFCLPGDVIQAVVRPSWSLCHYNLFIRFFGQDHCVLEDDLSLIAVGVSELGDETTIKVWVSKGEETGQTPTASEHQVGGPRRSKVKSGAPPPSRD